MWVGRGGVGAERFGALLMGGGEWVEMVREKERKGESGRNTWEEQIFSTRSRHFRSSTSRLVQAVVGVRKEDRQIITIGI